MNTDLVAFNEIYRSVTEIAGGQYVDLWDGFTGTDGEFISAGPDIDGQIVRLRNSDGINMTKPGKRKMAFYAERELRKVRGLGFDAQPDGGLAPEAIAPIQVPGYDPALTGRTVAMSLNNPAFDGFEKLEGDGDFLASAEAGSTSRELVEKGLAGNAPPGRVDAGWGAAKPGKSSRCPRTFCSGRPAECENKPAELSRQAGRTHQVEIDSARCLAAFADRPDDQRLSAAGVAGGEILGDAR